MVAVMSIKVSEGIAFQMKKLVEGACAAVLTPRKANGQIDESLFQAWLSFLVERGIRGFAINGATGEYCRATDTEFDRLMAMTAEVAKGRVKFVAGVGAATSDRAIALGRIASERRADALLLPMPYFFPYSQSDLDAFCRTVAVAVDAPVLLYNLPQFTTPLEPATALRLIRECDSIVGIKDSSGSLDTLQLLTRDGVDACRIIGSDQVLSQALSAGLCDAVVSGTACVFPELICNLYSLSKDDGEFRRLGRLLDSVLDQGSKLPVPWELKVLAECRGLAAATFPFPLSAERQAQKAKLQAWYRSHASELTAEFRLLPPHQR